MKHTVGQYRLRTKIIKQAVKDISYLIPNRKKRKAFLAYWVKKLKIGQTEAKDIYRYLERYYKNINIDSGEICENIPCASLPIWQLWLQGEEQAPVLVRKCFESIRRYNPDREIIIVTENTLANYIELPGYLMTKYKQGIIPRAHFSDIIRVCLLTKYGGTWIDATVLLTDKIPENILEQDFFGFSGKDPVSGRITLGHISFFCAKPKHILMQSMQKQLFDYWKNENSVITYLFFNVLFNGMVNSNPLLEKVWQSTLHVDSYCLDNLSKNFIEPFNEAFLLETKNKTFIHKLTYYTKYQKKIRKGTFLDVFQNTDLVF